MKLTRREFFVKTCQGAAVIAVPTLLSSIIEGCSNNSNPVSNPSSSGLQTINASAKNNVITLTVDSSSPLSAVGSAALIQFSNGNLLIDRSDQNTFNALSAICTHQGCLINYYDSGNKQFVCPCHGSRFGLNGQVVQGPASRPLSQYQTQFNNNQLSISV
jgi:cytochrome b6-f complex iron-sulfur subunit